MKTPRPYQQEAIDLGQRRPLLLGDACGLGKTLQGVEMMRPVQSGRILIATRKLLIPQWEETLREQGFEDIRIVTTQTPDRFKRSQQCVLLMHYEAAVRHADIIRRMHFDGVILDEAHLIGNRKTQRTKAIKLLATRSDRRVCLTATPMTKTPAGLWSLSHWLYPKKFTSYWEWHHNFVITDQVWTPRGYKDRIVVGCKNPELLAETLAPFYLARRKEDVAPELPDKIYQTVELDMSQAQKTTFHELTNAKDIVVELQHSPDPQLIQNAMTLLVRQLQLTSMPRILNINDDGVKVDWIREYVADNPDIKMIIFTAFRPTAIALKNYFQDQCTLILGGGKMPNLNDLQRVVVATLDVAAYGLDMPDYDVAVFCDAKYSPDIMYQAEERIHRIGSVNTKLIIKLLCRGSSDLLPWHTVERGWDMWRVVQEAIQRKHLR